MELKKIQFKSRWMPLSAVLALIVGLSVSCRPGRNFYVIEELRVPAMQVLQKVDAPLSDKHCFDFSGEKVCQQYPLRPGQKYYFRLLALAPAGSQPVQLKFTKLKRTKLSRPVSELNSSEISCDSLFTEVDASLASLGLSDSVLQSTVKQETPLRVEEHVVSFTLPDKTVFDTELFAESLLPLYRIEYEASSGNLRADKGSLTFPVVSESQASGSQSQTSSNAAACLSAVLSGVPSVSANVAPSILSLTPGQNEVVGGSPVTLQMNFGDTASAGRRRVQWYISRGELQNQRSSSTELKFSGSEPLTAVGIVRDLQGGVDFAWSTFSANQ